MGDNSAPSGGGDRLLGIDIGSLLKLPLEMEGQRVSQEVRYGGKGEVQTHNAETK